MLTVVVGNKVGDVDFPITPLLPKAASGGAGVSVSVGLQLDSNVSSDQGGFIKVRGYKTNTGFVVALGLESILTPPYDLSTEVLHANSD